MMKSFGRYSATAFYLSLVGALLLLVAPSDEAHAQAQAKWLDMGDLAHIYYDSGSSGIAGPGVVWPYIKGSTGNLGGYHDGYELMIGTTNWTDEEGSDWPYKVSYTNTGSVGESTYPQEISLVSKYPERDVVVNLRDRDRINVEVDEVNPNMEADRMLRIVTNLDMGLTLTKRVYQFSQEYHDDYHITEMVLTNTGNVDDDDEVELPDQTLEGVYLWWDMRWGQTGKTSDVIGRLTRWGSTNMHDIVRDGDLRANYTWAGRVGDFTEYDPIGASAIDASGSFFPSGQDTTGRLHAIGIASTFALHADHSVEDRSDDTNQPTTMFWGDANGMQATGTNALDVAQMEEHYTEWFTAGIPDQFYAHEVEPDGEFAHQSNTTYPTAAGARVAHGYGPYTIPPGDSIRVVIGQGVHGIPYDAALDIGRKFKRLYEQNNEYGDIEYDADADGEIQEDEVMDKNEWAINAATDSSLAMAERAMANWDAGFDIPQPPAPPSSFEVNSAAGGVEMSWEYDYADEDPPGGFEIYRARNFFEGTVEEDYEYQKVAELDGSARSYKDTSGVARGIDHYYYITAVGEELSEPGPAGTPAGVRLRSSRYYTQTYVASTALRTPGEELSDIRVVPNPFHIGASANLRYPGQERIGFLDIPGECTIKIYTERGDLVKTIEHTDGTGDEFWDLMTDAQQMIVSGLYIAAIEDHDSGETVFEKFIVVR